MVTELNGGTLHSKKNSILASKKIREITPSSYYSKMLISVELLSSYGKFFRFVAFLFTYKKLVTELVMFLVELRG